VTTVQQTLAQWTAEVRRIARLRDEGLPSENLLRVFLETMKRADLTLPEIELSYFRRPHAGGEIGIDGWGTEDDETVGDEVGTARAIRLHVVAFIHSDATEEGDALNSRGIEDAIYRAEQFVLQSAIRGRSKALYQEIADSSGAADAAEYIYRNYDDITEIALHILSDFPIDDEVNIEEISEPRQLGEAKIRPAIWGITQLYEASITLHEPENSDVVLDLIRTNDDGEAVGHPVTAVGETGGWEVYVTAFTGTQLVRFYEKYKLRLVNENVRAFLQFKGATNKGIKTTIEDEPEQFISYNNGISIVARNVTGTAYGADEGDHGEYDTLFSIEGAQIVNGGQTTAALFHASQDPVASRNIDKVRVFAKITVLPNEDEDAREAAIAKIARYSNSQNSIKSSDLESNWGYFRDLANAAEDCPVPDHAEGNADTIWFFERSRGRFAETKAINDANWLTAHPETQVIDKTLLADVMNCVSGRPFDAQKGGEGLIKNYLKWLRPRNKVDGRHRDQTPRGFAFFGDNQFHAHADHDDLEQEWQGVVASVIVRRELEQVFASTEGWMRSVQIRYVLALAYQAFAKDEWLDIWESQDVEQFYADLLAGRHRDQATFADWARAAGDVVEQRIKKLSRDEGTAINDIAKQKGTWLPVLEAAKRKGLL
jgi:hypothetical protein